MVIITIIIIIIIYSDKREVVNSNASTSYLYLKKIIAEPVIVVKAS